MNTLAHLAKQNGVGGELANLASLTRFDLFAASIAHEVNQPLTGIITNASTCLRMLAADLTLPPPNVSLSELF